MASRTAVGFWAEAPLSRYTSGLPCTCSARTGKSLRTRSTSKARVELSPDRRCGLSCPRVAMSVLPGTAGQPVADGGHQRRADALGGDVVHAFRSEEHTSELQSLMRISYAVFCLQKNNIHYQLCQTL